MSKIGAETVLTSMAKNTRTEAEYKAVVHKCLMVVLAIMLFNTAMKN